MKKLQKLDFSTFQFFHARGDISEMQRNSFMDWCDSNPKAAKKNKKGRTMAFQISEELFQRIKRHMERETLRTGKAHPAGLRAEPTHAGAENTMEQNAHTEAPVAPCVANETVPTGTDTPNEDKAV